MDNSNSCNYEQTKRRKSFKWQAARVLLIVTVGCYAILLGLGCAIQRSIIFPGTKMSFPLGAPQGLDAQCVERKLEDGGLVPSWYCPCRGEAQALVVYAHGNAECAAHQTSLVRFWHQHQCDVLLLEYRGYAGAGGSPSQDSLVDDACWMTAQVRGRRSSNLPLILQGRSIGGHIMAQAALELQPQALLLHSSGHSVAELSWRFLMPPFIVADPFRTGAALEELPQTAVFISHGARDEIFALHHAERNAKRAAGPIRLEVDPQGTHNNADSFFVEMIEFLREQGVLPQGGLAR